MTAEARLVAVHELTGCKRRDAIEAMEALHATGFAPAWSAGQLAGLLSHSGAVAFTLHNGTREIGFAIARVAADEAEVLTIVTNLDNRRRGHARTILTALERAAAARGAAAIFLEVAEDNRAARALYESTGYIQVGRRRDYYAGSHAHAADALVLRKPLQSS